ncbi:hypothetical protein [Peptostreptococcus porci]|nr:hypothetical protein [Peptostreptococcus porci]
MEIEKITSDFAQIKNCHAIERLVCLGLAGIYYVEIRIEEKINGRL